MNIVPRVRDGSHRAWFRSIVLALIVVTSSFTTAWAADSDKENYKVFLNMSYSGNSWQSLAANGIKALAATPPYDEMLEFRTIISGSNVQKQISDIENMIAAGADAIIFYPLNPTALNRIVKRGCQQGVLFFAYDVTVTEPCAYNVSIIPANYGVNTAQWMVNQLDGEGDVFVNHGVAGTSNTEHYDEGALHIFGQYPGINVVSDYYGNWNNSTSQRKTAQALAAHPDVDGIWTVDGEWGTLRAVLNSDRDDLIVITGQSTNAYRLAIANQEYRDRGLVGLSSSSGPSVGGYAFKLMMEVLTGKREMDFHNVQYPLPWVTADEVKVCGGGAFVDGCNVFPADKVPSLFIDTALNAELVPELDLQSVQEGQAKEGSSIQPLPDPIKANDVPGVNCSDCSEDPDRFKPAKVEPIAVPGQSD